MKQLKSVPCGTLFVNGEISMVREDIDNILKDVIKEAKAVDIPVPANVHEHVYINPRPKRRFGCCSTKGGKLCIEISEFLLKATEKKIRGVIAHEVLHTCRGCRDHGPRWKEYAARMNAAYGYDIKRVSSFEELGLETIKKPNKEADIKYIIKCEKCGKEYPRQRFTCVMKKIDAYRCQCGGKLTLIIK